jgi:hypothetical protein
MESIVVKLIITYFFYTFIIWTTYIFGNILNNILRFHLDIDCLKSVESHAQNCASWPTYSYKSVLFIERPRDIKRHVSPVSVSICCPIHVLNLLKNQAHTHTLRT